MLLFSLLIIITITYGGETYNKKIDVNIPEGYFDSYKCSLEIGRDYSRYRYYYYEYIDDNKFKNNSNYVMVNESNIDEIKELFNIMKIAFENSNCRYGVNISKINIGDYVIISRSNEYYEAVKNGCKEKASYCTGELHFKVYFYDIDSHILYYIANSP